MNQRSVVGCLIAAVALSVPPPVVGQMVHGRVVDDSTGLPVVATLTLIASAGPTATTVQTATDGWFRIAVQPGEYRLRVQRVGYREWRSTSFALGVGQDVELVPRLALSPVELEPAEVVGQPPTRRRPLPEFERRREHGFGKFVTRVEFEKSNPRQLTDVLLRMPGLRLERNPCFMMDARAPGPCYNRNFLGSDPRRYVFRPRGGPISFGNARGGGEACGLLIYVDGRYVGDGFQTDLDLVAVEQVEAIEVYSAASQIPTELNRTGSACGVIVIWTR